MKAVSLASRVLAAALGVLVFVLMFFGIVHIASQQGTFELSAAQLAFGSTLSVDASGEALASKVDLSKSAWFFFTLVTSLIGAISAVAAFFKGNKAAVSSLIFGGITGLMMVLFITHTPGTYVDHRPLTGMSEFWYNNTFIVLLCVSLAFVAVTIASILLVDYVAVLESNGAKKVLWKRLKAWLLEYKSELRKITWPTFPTVVRNTVIVLILCAVVGAFIWVEDYGLSNLLKLIFGS